MKIYKTINESNNGLRKQVVMLDKGNYFTKHIERVNGIWQHCFSKSSSDKDRFQKKTYKYRFESVKV